MAIEVKKIDKKSDMKAFVKFPMELYKENNYYVPPIIKEELETLDPDRNPVFQHAEAAYYLAYKDGKLVGRVAAIVNWIEVKEQNKPKARFGWLDAVDDIEVFKALINKTEEFAKKHNLKELEGPVGFSNMEKAGVLIKGFEEVATMITWYHFPYYQKYLEELGFQKSNEWVEYRLTLPETLPEKVVKFKDLVQKRYKLEKLKFNNNSKLEPYVDKMFELLAETYKHLPSYVPIQQNQIDYYKKKYLRYVNHDFISMIAEKETGELVAFAITMPSYGRALQKAKGKFFPFGWFPLYQASKKNDTVDFYLIGVHPKYQGKGITAIIFYDFWQNGQKYGISKMETNPELEDNTSVQQLWNAYQPVNHKRRRTYIKSLGG